MMVDSNKKMLDPMEIIKIAAKNTKTDRSYDEVVNMLKVELTLKDVWKTREGNTLFIVHKSNEHPRYGYFRALNADTARNYLENSKDFADIAYDEGFDVLVTQFDDPSILHIFKMISKNPIREKMGFKAQKTKGGGYQVTLVLGPKRGGFK